MNIREQARARLRELARRELLRRQAMQSLSDFMLYTHSDEYLMGWVHKEICDTLDQFIKDVFDKKSPRLIITMPPRSGKSEIVSRSFPAYALGKNPNFQIIATSYSADLTSRFNRDVQRVIDSDPYREVFPDTCLNSKNIKNDAKGAYIRTSDLFEIVGHNGSYRSCGVGGGITGAGADIFIIDDPIKDRADADSATIREKVWDWYTSTAYTRLSSGGGMIVMCTRWHTDDLIGRLINHMNSGEGDKFTVINYPAIAEHDEPHRKKGEALHPERFSLERLEQTRLTVGSHDWASLYQQHPVPDGGAVFKLDNFKRYDDKSLPPSFDQVIGSWDMTFKDSASSDYVVGQVWGKKGVNLYLLDMFRGQWDFSKTLEMFSIASQKWSQVQRWLIEDKANGSAIINVLQKQIHGITPITPHESKLERAYAITPMIEGGAVYIPTSANWLNAFEDEVLNFPSGAHDDQIDSMTQALNFLRQKQVLSIHPNNLMALHRPRR